jgi:hypothetical protein
MSDVALLGRLVATDQKQVGPFAAPGEEHSVSRSDVNTHLREPLSDRLAVAEVAMLG